MGRSLFQHQACILCAMADEAREVVPFQVFNRPLQPVGPGRAEVVHTHEFDSTRETVVVAPPVSEQVPEQVPEQPETPEVEQVPEQQPEAQPPTEQKAPKGAASRP